MRITPYLLSSCKDLSTEMFAPFLRAGKRHWVLFQDPQVRTSSPDIVRLLHQNRH